MRDIETIDGELRLLFRAWHVAHVLSGRTPSTVHMERLLEDRAAALVLLAKAGDFEEGTGRA